MFTRWLTARNDAAERVQRDASDILRIGGGSRALAEARGRLQVSDRLRDASESRHWRGVIAELTRRKRFMIDENARERYLARRER